MLLEMYGEEKGKVVKYAEAFRAPTAGELSALEEFGNALPALFFLYDLNEHRYLLVNRALSSAIRHTANDLAKKKSGCRSTAISANA